MIRLFLHAMKLAILAAVVLLIGQIPVAGQRIHDHVRDFTQHHHVQLPIRWISERFDFTEGRIAREISRGKDTASAAAASEHSQADRQRLSALLKRR